MCGSISSHSAPKRLSGDVHHIVDLLLAPHAEPVVEALRALVPFAGRPDHARAAAPPGLLADALDQPFADAGRACMRCDVELLQEQAVAERRAGEIRVEDGKAQQAAVGLGDQADRSAVRWRDQESGAWRARAVGRIVAVVALVLFEQAGKIMLVALLRVSDLHDD